MKVLGTNVIIGGKPLERLKQLGYKGGQNQFYIICGCRGMRDANEKCKALGMRDNVFVRNYTSETGNKESLELASDGSVWILVDGTVRYNHGCGFVRAEEIFCNTSVEGC